MSFSNAQGVTVNGGVFADVQGNFNSYNIQSTPETGITQLKNEISESLAAFHDSAEHRSPPEHHPEAQTQVLKRIFKWIKGDDQLDQSVLWLHGPAGVGKSAIAHTVAERSAQSKELAASFFFSRSKPGCDTARVIWASIAYQIAISIPALRKKIGEAVEDDPAICQKSLPNQLQKLIIDPFTLTHRKLEVMNTLARLPFLVIIDGLDECKMHADQRDVLRSVASVINTHQLPLRFLITSHSEDPIRTEFDSPVLQSACLRILHSAMFYPEQDDHWQAFRSNSDSRWKPFFDANMNPTPMFETLMDNLFTYLDSSNSGLLYPEVTSSFLEDLGCPLKANVWKSMLHACFMSKSMADKMLMQTYDILSIDYVPGERAQPPPQVSNTNPNGFGNIFDFQQTMSSLAPSSPTSVPLLTPKGFLHLATIEMLRDPSTRWQTLGLMLKKYDLSQYKGWGDLPRNVLPDRPDKRTMERLADSATLLQAKIRQDQVANQMGYQNRMKDLMQSMQNRNYGITSLLPGSVRDHFPAV